MVGYKNIIKAILNLVSVIIEVKWPKFEEKMIKIQYFSKKRPINSVRIMKWLNISQIISVDILAFKSD